MIFMNWMTLDAKTLEYIGVEPRCCKCSAKLGNDAKGYSRSEKNEIYCERCRRKVEREEGSKGSIAS